MNPDDLHALLAAARPEPPPALRARVLAAAYMVEKTPPWWGRVRTWSAAAAALLIVNWLVVTNERTSHPSAELPSQLAVWSSEDVAHLPPALVAWLQQPRPPEPKRNRAPPPCVPFLLYGEIQQ